ncbi:hypothetical protein [Pseudomonas sp. ANT_H12B]|uniref:hypothetical protein n=1 Tax=Pseudomonas sp. ANT_H12B TaxID=2597348 RepID=UPI0011EFD74D|nr:hypothetical protein [Pseudomonas sp. ANT_H12B]KAA0954703.1 hypothetical protein FQ185_29195 [Pseudomonas sp. ANT_H12B]
MALNIKVFWINQSFHNDTDYALPEEFEHGFLQLSVPSQDPRCALMYSETVLCLWLCHRGPFWRPYKSSGDAEALSWISGQPEVCLKLMPERKSQQFSEAHSLSCAALDLLDRLYLDWKFSASIMRRDEIPISKYHDAIEHLRVDHD